MTLKILIKMCVFFICLTEMVSAEPAFLSPTSLLYSSLYITAKVIFLQIGVILSRTCSSAPCFKLDTGSLEWHGHALGPSLALAFTATSSFLIANQHSNTHTNWLSRNYHILFFACHLCRRCSLCLHHIWWKS